jgi:hypothetical protein
MAGGPLALLAVWLRGLRVASFAAWAALCCALPLPGVSGVVNSVAGLVYGTLGGTLVFTAVATLGAVATFLVGRSALRERVARATARWRPQIRALDMAVEQDAFKIIVLLVSEATRAVALRAFADAALRSASRRLSLLACRHCSCRSRRYPWACTRPPPPRACCLARCRLRMLAS